MSQWYVRVYFCLIVALLRMQGVRLLPRNPGTTVPVPVPKVYRASQWVYAMAQTGVLLAIGSHQKYSAQSGRTQYPRPMSFPVAANRPGGHLPVFLKIVHW